MTEKTIVEQFLRRRFRQHSITCYQRSLRRTLTFEQFRQLVISPCFYCGKETDGGIDRLDWQQGYTPENCVSSCRSCNGRKSIYERLPNGMQLFIEAQKRKGIQHIAEWPFR